MHKAPSHSCHFFLESGAYPPQSCNLIKKQFGSKHVPCAWPLRTTAGISALRYFLARDARGVLRTSGVRCLRSCATARAVCQCHRLCLATASPACFCLCRLGCLCFAVRCWGLCPAVRCLGLCHAERCLACPCFAEPALATARWLHCDAGCWLASKDHPVDLAATRRHCGTGCSPCCPNLRHFAVTACPTCHARTVWLATARCAGLAARSGRIADPRVSCFASKHCGAGGVAVGAGPSRHGADADAEDRCDATGPLPSHCQRMPPEGLGHCQLTARRP